MALVWIAIIGYIIYRNYEPIISFFREIFHHDK